MDDNKSKYDIENLAEELGVEMDKIAPLFSSFIIEMKEEIEEMEIFLSRNDWCMLERTVHNIKGVSSNLGIYDIYEEAVKFDEQLKKGCRDSSAEFVNNMTKLINNAEIEIKSFFERKGLSL